MRRGSSKVRTRTWALRANSVSLLGRQDARQSLRLDATTNSQLQRPQCSAARAARVLESTYRV